MNSVPESQAPSSKVQKRITQVVAICLFSFAILPLTVWGTLLLIGKPLSSIDLTNGEDWISLGLVLVTGISMSASVWSFGFKRPMSILRISERNFRSMRLRDPLTGLITRDGLRKTLAQMRQEANTDSRAKGLLLLDVDRFRVFNDLLGQPEGDKLLRSVADRIRAVVRGSDLIARVGSNQFAVLTEGVTDEQGMIVMAKNILRAFEASYPVGGRETAISLSIGVLLINESDLSVDEIFRRGELALRSAKQTGGGRFQLYESRLPVDAKERLETDLRLRRAAKRNEFSLYYQAIMDAESGKITAVEALLRWFDPIRGSVSPTEFIPLIEQTGQIVEVGTWVLETACLQCLEWINNGADEIVLSVNVSPRQFAEQDFVDTVAQVLKATNFPASQLQLEVTEGLLLDPSPETLSKIDALVGLGTRLALDDFGMGYSSLAYLTKFPLHTLKIDRMFVRNIPKNERDSAIVRAIVDLGHGLGMHVTAEGVESADQSEALRSLGCDSLQGYLFARPVPPDKIPSLLASGITPKKQPGSTTTASPSAQQPVKLWVPVDQRIRVLRNDEVLADSNNAMRLVRADSSGTTTALCLPLCDVRVKLGPGTADSQADTRATYDLLGSGDQILHRAIAHAADAEPPSGAKSADLFIAFSPQAVTIEETA